MTQPSPADAQGRLTLFVSNQSFAEDPVGITISIDGDVVVHDDFSVGAQNNWIAFEVPLAPGNHELAMKSSTGVEADAALSMGAGGHRWGSVAYWYRPPDRDRACAGHAPRRFSLTLSDEPIGLA